MKNQLLIAVPIVWTNENFTEGKKSLETHRRCSYLPFCNKKLKLAGSN